MESVNDMFCSYVKSEKTVDVESIHRIDLNYNLSEYNEIIFLGSLWNKEKIL